MPDTMDTMRVIYFWTPTLSADILTYLLTCDTEVKIVWVVTNPDKKSGRGHEVITSPVWQVAYENNLSLYQPEKIKDEVFLETIRNLKPDICIVVAYGKILPQILLDIPPKGFLNVHTSLLPLYRWASPIQSALLHGEKTTGLTIMQMSLWMDEGDILLQESWTVEPSDTTSTLFEKTGKRGWPMLIEVLQQIKRKTLSPLTQDHTQATYTDKIKKEDGEFKPDWTIVQTYRSWQAYTSWPGLSTQFSDMKVTLLEIETYIPQPEENLIFVLGNWYILNHIPAIKASDGYILVQKIHPSGKKAMNGEDFVRWYMIKKSWF